MGQHDFCRQLLAQARHEARKAAVKLPKGLHASCLWEGLWAVYSATEHIWEGDADCAFHARAQAIFHLIDQKDSRQ